MAAVAEEHPKVRRDYTRCVKCREPMPPWKLVGNAIEAFLCKSCRKTFASPHAAELFIVTKLHRK